MSKEKKKVTEIPIGPYHPLQEEPEFFRLQVEGEKVVGLEIELGYNHRGIEKLSESKSFDQILFLVERICGICSTSHPFAYVNAVEDLAGFKIPEKAKYIRTIVGEMERIHSHLLWLGLAGHFLGYNTVWMWSWKYREPLLEICEKVFGNRQHYAMMKIGGVRRDIDISKGNLIKKGMEDLLPKLDMLQKAVEDDPVIRARLKIAGTLPKKEAREYCVVGPTARASGINIDIRKDDPYAAYDLVNWDVSLRKEGDVYAKTMVRLEEMRQSAKIIKQCVDKLSGLKGDIDIDIKEIPEGEGIGRHEAPRGEVFHYVKSHGGSVPYRHKVKAPSYANVLSDEFAVIGGTIPDAALTLAAVDPCYCCTERMQATDEKGRKYSPKELIKLSQEKTEEIRKKQAK
ncbi:MAG: nickel-dependent hydrogenase large subunit [Elusimicrobia bacterium]|jgi:membrane-bound hydrogenase subunit alpha|nr:nickel-dependent hydrogenase large subunit [Elusimicrobiota bacterium]